MESGLLSLRAELLKKKSQIKTSKLEVHPEIKPLLKERKSLKRKTTKTSKDISLHSEDALKLEKSKQALERKARLYDEIKSGTKVLEDDELNERFLVNFQGKIYNEVSEISSEKNSAPKIPSLSENELTEAKGDLESNDNQAGTSSEEWVEYTDSFGRSRICLREDLEHMEKKGSHVEIRNVHKEKWEMIEDQSENKNNIHYQDVLFDEARSHGTSFMPFSRDEKEREAQQQLLKDIGSQANKIHLTKEALKKKRQKMMELRLAKVREKKRLKMGLPVKDIDSLKIFTSSDEEEDNDSHIED
ncbi:hypothetical protein Avbf_12242 [Armadillidium vulgare]|nr:hypothetical protein Avbf_12242 [Armadillidium vulgare]